MEIIFTAFFEIIAAAVAPAMAAAASMLCMALGAILAPLTMLAELVLQSIFKSRASLSESGQREAAPTPPSPPKPLDQAPARDTDTRVSPPTGAGPSQESDTTPEVAVGTDTVKHPLQRTWTRQVTKVSVIVLAATVAFIAVLQWAFLPSVVRWTLARAEKKSGVAFHFEKVSGNLITGRFELSDIRIERSGHDLSDYVLRIPHLTINLDMSRVIRRKLRFDLISAVGARGSYLRKGKRPPDAPKKEFEVAMLRLNDAIVEVKDQTHQDLPPAILEITTAEFQPLRGDQAVTDVFLHAQLDGRVNDQAITAVSESTTTSGSATWTLREASVQAMTALVGPLSWIDEGNLTGRLVSQWREPQTAIPIHCEFRFENVAAHVPDDASAQTRLLAAPVLNWINKHATEFELSFDVRVPREALAGQIWLANSALVTEIGKALKDEVTSVAMNFASAKDGMQDAIKEKAIEAAKDAAKNTAKSLFERFQKD